MKSRHNLVWLVSALLLIVSMLASAACGGAPAPAPTKAPAPATTAAPAPAAAAPKYGGIVNYPLASAPGGFDAHRMAAFSPFVVIPVFNNLVRMDPTKKENDPANIVGDLAESWTVSPDGKSVTFKLRKGVTWHDGSAFTADDVVYTFAKIMDPARSSMAGSFTALDKFVKVDDFTVTAQLKNPSPSFLINLCIGYSPIQAAKSASLDYRKSEFLMGTGPFKLAKETPGVSFEFVKNPNYFKKDAAGRQLPYLDGFTVWIMADRTAVVNAFVSGRLNMMTPGIGITNQEQMDTFKALAPKNTVIDWYTPTYGNAMFINHNYEPLKNLKVRQAIMLMADRTQMLIASYGDTGWGTLGSGWFSPLYGLPAKDVNAIFGEEKPYADRVAQAKALMKDAGYEKGFDLVLLSSAIPEIKNRHSWLIDKLSQINIKATLVQPDAATVTSRRNAGDFGIYDANMSAYMSDPDEARNLFYSGSTGNFMKYSNKALDALWDQQAKATDLASRQQLTRQLEKGLLEDVAAIPLPFQRYANAWYPEVKGFVLQMGIYSSALSMERVWIDK
jgi:peptide/nickel transport system substrate-binding protein